MVDYAPTKVKEIAWAPLWHQYDFVRAREEGYDYRWLSAGVGTGKTTIAVIEDLILATEINPGKKGLIVVPDFPTFTDVVLPEIEQWWPAGCYTVGRSSGRPEIRVKTKKGVSQIFVRSAHDGKSVRKLVGLTVSWVHMEEMARMAYGEMAWDMAAERCREPAAYNGIHVSSTPLPGFLPEIFGVEDGIPREALVQGVCTKTERHYEDRSGRLHTFRYWVRRARVEDNPYLHPSYAARLRARFVGEFAKQELDGQVVGRSARVFPPWMAGLHVLPNDVADRYWRRARRVRGAADWGFTMPAALVMGGWLSDGEFLAIDEWYHSQRQTEEQGWAALQMQRQWAGGKRIEWKCDPEEPKSIAKWNAGFMFTRPDNGRWEKIRLRASKADNTWRTSVDEINILLARRGGVAHPTDLPHERTGAPRLYVAERCANLIREMKGLRYKLGADGRPLGDTEHEGDDHAVDCLRYLVRAEQGGLHYSGISADSVG